MIKGKGQRLIPEELLKYLEALKNKYPNAVDLVEANPTLEGGEDSLSSVLINGTKYAVGGGDGKLYMHHILGTQNESFILYTTDSTPFTTLTITNFLKKCSPINITGTYYPVNDKYFWHSLSVVASRITRTGFYNNNGVWTEHTVNTFDLSSDTVTEV